MRTFDVSRYSLTLPRLHARAGANEAVANPGHVDHLHNHTPVTLCDHPTSRAASKAITGLYIEHQTTLMPSDSNQMETLQVDEQITPIKRHRAAARRVKHHPQHLTNM